MRRKLKIDRQTGPAKPCVAGRMRLPVSCVSCTHMSNMQPTSWQLLQQKKCICGQLFDQVMYLLNTIFYLIVYIKISLALVVPNHQTASNYTCAPFPAQRQNKFPSKVQNTYMQMPEKRFGEKLRPKCFEGIIGSQMLFRAILLRRRPVTLPYNLRIRTE